LQEVWLLPLAVIVKHDLFLVTQEKGFTLFFCAKQSDCANLKYLGIIFPHSSGCLSKWPAIRIRKLIQESIEAKFDETCCPWHAGRIW